VPNAAAPTEASADSCAMRLVRYVRLNPAQHSNALGGWFREAQDHVGMPELLSSTKSDVVGKIQE